MFTRSVPYNPGPNDRKKIKWDYSIANNKIIKQYKYWFVRECDFPYTGFTKHYLLIPITINGNMNRHELYMIEKEWSVEGYYVLLNPTIKQSCRQIYHKHLLKI